MASMSRRGVWFGGAAVAVAVGAWLAFGYFGVQTLFLDDEVHEAAPVFESGVEAGEATVGTESTPASDEVDEVDDNPASPPEAPAGETAGTEVVVAASGQFVDRSHPTSGSAVVLTDGTEQRFVRFEDFETDNGPDLVVYLSAAGPDAEAGAFDDDFVELGDLRGNVGEQNYEIPADVDLSRYSTVVIWCDRFDVAFGVAALS